MGKDAVDNKQSNGEAMYHMAQDSDSNDDVESDKGVVVDGNRRKTIKFSGVTCMDNTEVVSNARVKII